MLSNSEFNSCCYLFRNGYLSLLAVCSYIPALIIEKNVATIRAIVIETFSVRNIWTLFVQAAVASAICQIITRQIFDPAFFSKSVAKVFTILLIRETVRIASAAAVNEFFTSFIRRIEIPAQHRHFAIV